VRLRRKSRRRGPLGKFIKLMIIISSIVLILLFIHLYVYLRARKKPYNNPSHFINNEKFALKTKVIVCVGDSITHGRVSCNYVDLLSQRLGGSGFELVNAGVNGELATDVLQRMDEVIRCDPDFITILIGTNEIYASLGRKHSHRVMRNTESAEMHGQEDHFRVNLIKICSHLSAHTKAKIALLSLPPIGEELDHVAYLKATRYSRVIKEVSIKVRLNYIAVHEAMTDYLKKKNTKTNLRLNHNLLYVMVKGILLHYIFGRSFDEISKSNGFVLLTDFLHLNSKGAEMIADLIQDFVTGDSRL
jgi:lysophospholipase L1-like esterase